MKDVSKTILYAKGHTEHEKFSFSESSSGFTLSMLHDKPNKDKFKDVKISYRGFVDLLGRCALVASASSRATILASPDREEASSERNSVSAQTSTEKINDFLAYSLHLANSDGENVPLDLQEL